MIKPWRLIKHPHRVAAVVLALGIPTAPAAEGVPWHSVAAEGHVILLRHALAPGTGDPPDFELGDCSTQRNLNDAGRKQAQRIGQRLKRAGLGEAPVYTSQWCRCRDTAQALALGEPQVLTALNSFYERRDEREQRVDALRQFLAERHEAPTAILVTHQVNITAVTDVFPASGEAIIARVLKDGSLEVIETVTTPPPRR